MGFANTCVFFGPTIKCQKPFFFFLYKEVRACNQGMFYHGCFLNIFHDHTMGVMVCFDVPLHVLTPS